MTTNINLKAKNYFIKNETLLFEANNMHVKVHVPKKLKWNELSQVGKWKLLDIAPPKSIEEISKPSNITQQTVKSIQIDFLQNLVPILKEVHL